MSLIVCSCGTAHANAQEPKEPVRTEEFIRNAAIDQDYLHLPFEEVGKLLLFCFKCFGCRPRAEKIFNDARQKAGIPIEGIPPE